MLIHGSFQLLRMELAGSFQLLRKLEVPKLNLVSSTKWLPATNPV